MTKKRSKVIVGVGVLCFVGAMALWLGVSGHRAIADNEAPLITKTLTQAVDAPMVFSGNLKSKVAFVQSEGLVQRLNVKLDIATSDAGKVKVYLTSPTGTRVLIVDGARSKAATKSGIKGSFGTDGMPTVQSLSAFSGEPVAGKWMVSINSNAAGQLKSWSVTADVGPNTTLAGMETYGLYDDGCDCRVGSSQAASGLLGTILLLGLVLIRRRRR